MGETTKIAWATSTFNPVIGCVKVSPGCANCYAEAQTHRYGWDLWGVDKPRRMTSDAYWKQLDQWERKAAETKTFWSVFVGSLCDVAEDHPDWLIPRDRLKDAIDRTPHLTYLFLSKRPENYLRFYPAEWWKQHPNVWAGTTTENQAAVKARAPIIVQVPAAHHFISVEPMLESIDSSLFLQKCPPFGHASYQCNARIDWVICGCESGPKRREMRDEWAESLRLQCLRAKVPFFMKQMVIDGKISHRVNDWPEWARVQEQPEMNDDHS